GGNGGRERDPDLESEIDVGSGKDDRDQSAEHDAAQRQFLDITGRAQALVPCHERLPFYEPLAHSPAGAGVECRRIACQRSSSNTQTSVSNTQSSIGRPRYCTRQRASTVPTIRL